MSEPRVASSSSVPGSDPGGGSLRTGAVEDDAYCGACNLRFRPLDADRTCPQCGVTAVLEDPSRWRDTLLLRGPASASAGPFPTDEEDPSLGLVGRDLHLYRCESLLGAGGMGRVFLALHRDLHRRCALKVLCPRLVRRDAEYVERFRQEGRAAAGLSHPHIVTVHAIGEADGLHFLEMEFLAGRSLQQQLEVHKRLNPVRATTIALRLADGLAHAHREGIVHRDLKPDNVLLTPHGIPKIADFGLAKRVRAEEAPGTLAGTPRYMAPELFLGAAASPATDVYALGVCYFRMLAGRLPHEGRDFGELRRAVLTDPLPDVRALVPDVPLEVAECLSRLLAKDPDQRPADGAAATQFLLATSGDVQDLETLLAAAFGSTQGVSWSGCGARCEVRLDLPNGRRQTVVVETSPHGPLDRLLLIYSVCAPARQDFHEQALRLNAEIPHGGLAIRDVDGEACFVMVDTYPRGTVDAEEVRRSVLEVGCRADELEHRLAQVDRY